MTRMQSLRVLRKSPGLAAVAIGSLALGIGANVTVYSIVRELVLDDVTAVHPERLTYINADIPYPLYRDLRHTGVFQELASYHFVSPWNWRHDGRRELAWTIAASANFFDVLGARPYAGRLYSESDEGRDVAVISYPFWHKRLASDPASIGKTLQLNDRVYTIIGILPSDYRSIYGNDFSPQVYVLAVPGQGRFLVFGRMRPGVSSEGTRQALVAAGTALGGAELGRRLGTLYPVSGFAAHAARTGDPYFLFLMALYGIAAMLALIACSNVAGLLLARSISRQHEIAIRKALGASRFQLVRHLLAEGAVLAAAGAAAGYALHMIVAGRLRLLSYPGAYGQPFEFHFEPDRGLLLYASLTALAALLVSSLLPALRSSRADLSLVMKQREPGFSLRRWNLRNAFLALQMVLSMVLLTVGVLFTRGFLHLVRTDPGFDVAHTLFAGVQPVRGQHQGDDYFLWREKLLRDLRSVPGVIAASSTTVIPLSGEVARPPLRREGEPFAAAREIYMTGVGDRYFTTFHIPILRGRDFESSDRTRKPIPAVINRTLASQLFGAGDPVGRRLVMGRDKEDLLEVIGVAAGTRIRTLGEDSPAAFFVPGFDTGLVARISGDSSQWVEPLRRALAASDSSVALDIRTMRECTIGAIWPMRTAAALVSSLSALGLLLTLIGLYASVSYSVSRRTREMGIRAALGASGKRIVWTALRDTLLLQAAAAAAGLLFAIAVVRPLAPLMPDGLRPWNPWMFAGIVFLLLSSGAAAAYLPARRAAAIDPAVSLRE
jgi:putative ABC transport system permease protein